MGADNQQNMVGTSDKNQPSSSHCCYHHHPKSSLLSFQHPVSSSSSSSSSTAAFTTTHWKDTIGHNSTDDNNVDDCSVATGSSSLSWSSPYYSPMKISHSGSNPSSPNSTISMPVATIATCCNHNNSYYDPRMATTTATTTTAATATTTAMPRGSQSTLLSSTNIGFPSNNSGTPSLAVGNISTIHGVSSNVSILPPLYHSISTPIVYQPINLNYPGLALLHASPPVFAVHDFLSPGECHHLIQLAYNMGGSSSSSGFGPAPVVGSSSSSRSRSIGGIVATAAASTGRPIAAVGEVSSMRTSSTCCLSPSDVPFLLQKIASILPTKPLDHWESPQIGRYERGQQYLQHYDAFDLSTESGQAHAANGGQRVVTILLYLNTVPPPGGCTYFPRLNHLRVQPRQGMALIFFPATIYGELDPMALHAAEPALDTTKYVSQIWIRQGPHQRVLLPSTTPHPISINAVNPATVWQQSQLRSS